MVANVAYLPKSYIHHYCNGNIVIKKNLRISAKKLKTESLGKKKIAYMKHIKNTVIPHGCHIYAKSHDIEKATLCAYPQLDHALPHWKCVLRCCTKCPSVNLPDQETDDHYPDTSTSISFHIYHLIARCKTHGRLLLTDKKSFCKCKHDTASEQSTKIYTKKELLMMETKIYNFHTSFYIPEI